MHRRWNDSQQNSLTLIKPAEALEVLRDLGQQRRIERGTTLAMEGEDADGFWWVIHGLVRIHQISSEGRLLELGRFGDGEIVAAALAFAEAPFPHHIEALQSSELLWFSHRTAWERITGTPKLASFFLQMLAGKCRLLQHRLRSHGMKTLRQRLLEYLQAQARPDGANHGVLQQSRKDLAYELGTTPETLSRALRKLCEDGFLEIGKRNFRLLHPDP